MSLKDKFYFYEEILIKLIKSKEPYYEWTNRRMVQEFNKYIPPTKRLKWVQLSRIITWQKKYRIYRNVTNDVIRYIFVEKK